MGKKQFGVMLDMSRNGVMKVDKVKEFVDYISKMGYNTLQLYTEDTFEVDNEPYFGYMRGGYTKADLKEIDAYCIEKGVELIPCIQVLAHLNSIFKWDEYNVYCHDVADILLVGAERTYKLLENIFKTLAECFTSRRVNVGMDEAFLVGRGNYLGRNGYHKRYDILADHLKRVLEIANKYGFKLSMWSDMYFRSFGGYNGKNPIPQEVIDSVPPEITLIYWGYHNTDKKLYRQAVRRHKKFNNEIWYAGSVHTCCNFVPYNKNVFKTMLPAISVMKEEKIDNIFMTLWGDDGNERSYFTALPALYRIKRTYDGEKSLKKIKQEFKQIVGEDYDRMLSLQLPQLALEQCRSIEKDKYVLYCDLFNYYYDDKYDGTERIKLLNASKRYTKYAKNSKFSYIYLMMASLSKVLALKYDMGDRIRGAYANNDKEVLKVIIADIKKMSKYCEEFYYLFRERWFIENNPSGFDIQDIRLPGLIGRWNSCKDRLIDYVNGKIDKIPELEVKKLPCFPSAHNVWGKVISTNVVYHGTDQS